MLILNFTDKISNIKTKINYWNRRSLTPITGKITVIKSILISSLNHLFISLPNPNEKLLKDLNEIFYSFIWTGTIVFPELKLPPFFANYSLMVILIEK